MKYSPDGTRQQSPEGLHKVVTLVNNQTASKNTTIIQEALADRGVIWLSGNGVFEINATLIIPSNTTIHIGAGIELKCTSTRPFPVFVNEHFDSSPKSVSSLTVAAIGHSMLRATATYSTTPDVSVGDYVLIKGDTTEVYNKIHKVDSVSGNTVTFLVGQVDGNTASATGTITATKADANIAIYGPGKLNGNFISGGFTANSTYLDHGIVLNNVDQAVVSGLELLDFRKYAVCMANAVYPIAENLTGDSGSGCVIIYGPSWYPMVRNISGLWGDDSVSFKTSASAPDVAFQPPNAGGTYYESGFYEHIHPAVSIGAGTGVVTGSGQNSVNSQADLQFALDTYGEAYLDESADFLVESLTMPAGSKITGNGTIRWNSDSNGTNTLIVGTGCTIEGITFRRLQSATSLSSTKVLIYVSTSSENVTFENLTFIAELDAGYTTYENFIYLEQHCSNVTVKGCSMTYGSNQILGVDCKNSQFINNTFKSSSSSGMRFYGGKYNKIMGNSILGRNVHNTKAAPSISGQSTQVGINFLSFGFLGSHTGVIGNQIIGNEIYGVSEEGIGIDTHGQTFADSFENKVLPIATIYSITPSGNRQVIVLQESTTVSGVAAATGWADQCYMIVMTGGAAGYIAPIITGQSTASGSTNTASITIPYDNGHLSAANGDKICITYGAMDNIIANNYIHNTTTGISLWGSAFRNTISGNVVNAIDTAIQVAEVLGGPITPNVNTYTLSYCGMNIITNNDIRLEYIDQPFSSDRGWSPLVVGVWAYGTISTTIDHHIGTEITNNRIIGSRNAIIGGTMPDMNDPGGKSVYGGTIANNRCMGGGGLAINKTTNLFVGPNYIHLTKENYRYSASADNTTLTEL